MSFILRQSESGLLTPIEIGAPEYYRGTQGEYCKRLSRAGYTSIPVLEFLNGQPWDDFALCWVHALRPTKIRVVRAEETTDAYTWRVTVYVDGDNRIESVRQEVEIGLRKQDRHGHDLNMELQQRKEPRG